MLRVYKQRVYKLRVCKKRVCKQRVCKKRVYRQRAHPDQRPALIVLHQPLGLELIRKAEAVRAQILPTLAQI